MILHRCWNHDGREAVCRCPACTILFTIQNYLVQASGRDRAFTEVFGAQLVVWMTWVALTPWIFRIARRARERGPFTPPQIARYIVVSIGFAFLHGLISSIDASVSTNAR